MTAPVSGPVSGRRWCWRPHDPSLALAISQRLDLPEVVGRVLAARGVGLDDAPAFLAPKVRDALPDPSHLLDLDVAVARLADAVRADEPIGLLGDYDVDGATSVALLARYLAAVGARTVIDVPDRLREGYGPNPGAMERLAAQGCRLIAVLDAGTTAFEALAAAKERGLEVIVIDHHVAEPRLPAAVGVINPNRADQASPVGDLAAVGVTFLVVVALNRILRERGHFGRRAEPDVRRWLDLVALGTICDVVPLTGLNRAFVVQGLKVATRRGNPGLTALAAGAGLREPPGAEQCGYVLGPRLNAGGRTGRSDLGATLLTSDAPDEVARIALELEELNRERRRLEREVLAAVERDVEAAGEVPPLLLVAGEGWSPGVVGLAAARLVEHHHRPAVVIGIADGVGKGSGRSVAGFDLGAAVIAARQAGLLLQGGGHPMAAGLTVRPDRVGELRAFLVERLAATLGNAAPPPPDLTLDGAVQVSGVSVGLASRLARLAPFGRGNPEPRFLVRHARAIQVRRIGEAHLDCWLHDPIANRRVRAVAFRSLDRPLGAALLQAGDTPLDVAGTIKLDHWQGQPRVSLQVEDLAPAGQPVHA